MAVSDAFQPMPFLFKTLHGVWARPLLGMNNRTGSPCYGQQTDWKSVLCSTTDWKSVLRATTDWKSVLRATNGLEVRATGNKRTGSPCYGRQTDWKSVLRATDGLEVRATGDKRTGSPCYKAMQHVRLRLLWFSGIQSSDASYGSDRSLVDSKINVSNTQATPMSIGYPNDSRYSV